mgnify:CR=1 FL=1
MTYVDIRKLAQLSRIAIGDDDIQSLEKDIPSILNFVEQISQANAELVKEPGVYYNVLREDSKPHESQKYTEELLKSMPSTKDGYLKVRKIIQQD